MPIDPNKQAADDIVSEAEKLGIKTGRSAQDTAPAEKEEAESLEDDKGDESGDDTKDAKSDDGSDEEEPEDGSEGEDGEDEGESDEDKPKARRPRKHIPKEDYDRRKKAWEEEKAELTKKLAAAERKSAGPSDARKKLYERLKDADPKFDTSSLDEVIDTIRDELSGSSGSVPSGLQEKLDAIDEFMDSQRDAVERSAKAKKDSQVFDGGWDDILPEIESAFPKMNQAEREEAKGLLGRLWRTKEFHKSDVYRVFSKNKAKFEEIMSPHDPGLETGRTQGATDSSNGKVRLSKNPSAKEIQSAEKRIAEIVGEEDQFRVLDDQL